MSPEEEPIVEDAPHSEDLPPGNVIKIIPDITYFPILPNSLYAFDIDNTLVCRDLDKEWVLCETHQENRRILHEIKEKSDIIYITARDPSSRKKTESELQDFNYPKCQIFFAVDKRAVLERYLNR